MQQGGSACSAEAKRPWSAAIFAALDCPREQRPAPCRGIRPGKARCAP